MMLSNRLRIGRNRWTALWPLGLLGVCFSCGVPPETPSLEVKQAEEPQAITRDFPCIWQPLDSPSPASFRGLSAVDNNTVWISGTEGTWGRSSDGGATWQMGTVPEAAELDFRDVDAFDDGTAYLMSAGPGDLSRIFKTTDGGTTWQHQHTNTQIDGFFDGMAFWDQKMGIVYGDPVEGAFSILTTQDGGATWTSTAPQNLPPALDGEAGFAASGTGVVVVNEGLAWFGTGGPQARVFRSTDFGQSWAVATTPVLSGAGSMGIFSLAFRDAQNGIAVGGDYTVPEQTVSNAARTTDGGQTWSLIEGAPPSGYRSAVAYAAGGVLLALGTSGSDVSLTDGLTWQKVDSANYNALALGSSPCSGWAAGPEGKLARLTSHQP